MARKVFYSFYFKEDCVRTSQVRNIGALEGNVQAKDNDWETIVRGGDAAIQKWIDGQMSGRSCTIVLVGANTADRKWIDYEIKKSWDSKMGLLGIRIHKLLNFEQKSSSPGRNPFEGFTTNNGTVKLSSKVTLHDPAGLTSKDVYATISDNMAAWVEAAIKARA